MLLTVAAGLLGFTAGPLGMAKADVTNDYLIQQVCDDGAGGHTSADPYTCPATARKLRVGELLPYHKWDGATPSTAIQIADEFPVADISDRLRVISTFFYDNQNAFVPPFFDAADPQAHNSSYDLFGADGSYVAGIATYDIGRGWQPFWHTTSCSLSDAWIFFPKNATIPFGQGNTTATLRADAAQCPSISSPVQAATYWNYYPNMSYESGKQLNTIKSFHFSGGSINSDAIEMFYFTKQYGKTRWEAWVSSAHASGPNMAVVAKCPTNTNNGVSVFGTTTYYLQDCHDWSNIVADPNGGWDPTTWHVDPLFTSTNVLRNTHMQCTGSNGLPKDCNSGGICQTITPWQRFSNLNWGFVVFPQLQASENCGLQFSIPTAWDGIASIYQDAVTPLPSGTTYSYGAALWTPGASGAQVLVRVYESNSASTVITWHDFTVTLTGQRKFFEGSFVKNAATQHMRIQVYPLTANVNYTISDTWLAPKP